MNMEQEKSDKKEQKYKINIFASDLATAIGINQYQTIGEIIIKLWIKIMPDDYEKVKEELKQKDKIEVIVKENDMEYLKKMDKEGLKFSKIEECMKISNTKDLVEKRAEIMKDVINSKTVKPEIKKEICQKIESITNKNFGTNYETDAVKLYMEKTGKKVKMRPEYIKKKLCEYKNIEWYLGGKIDGITEDNVLIEIKNRIHKLFMTMRDYEKPQFQSYLFILGLKCGHLVEVHKISSDGIGVEINVIEEQFDEKYWKEIILVKMNNFIKLFHLFLNDIEMKKMVLTGKKENVQKTLMKLLE